MVAEPSMTISVFYSEPPTTSKFFLSLKINSVRSLAAYDLDPGNNHCCEAVVSLPAYWLTSYASKQYCFSAVDTGKSSWFNRSRHKVSLPRMNCRSHPSSHLSLPASSSGTSAAQWSWKGNHSKTCDRCAASICTAVGNSSEISRIISRAKGAGRVNRSGM